LGEFDHHVLLRQYTNASLSEASGHWRGGVFRVYEHKKLKYPVLAYASSWDSERAAHEFFTLYLRVLRGKWKELEIDSRIRDEIRGTGSSGRFLLRVSGSKVESLEGFPSGTVKWDDPIANDLHRQKVSCSFQAARCSHSLQLAVH